MKKYLLTSVGSGKLLQVCMYGLIFMVMTLGLASCDSKSDSEEPQTEDSWPPDNFEPTMGPNPFLGYWELSEVVNFEGDTVVHQGDPILCNFQDKGIWQFHDNTGEKEDYAWYYAWYSFNQEIIKLYMPYYTMGCEKYSYEFNANGSELKMNYQGNDYVIVERHDRTTIFKKVIMDIKESAPAGMKEPLNK